jgi:hypothetical protein
VGGQFLLRLGNRGVGVDLLQLEGRLSGPRHKNNSPQTGMGEQTRIRATSD